MVEYVLYLIYVSMVWCSTTEFSNVSEVPCVVMLPSGLVQRTVNGVQNEPAWTFFPALVEFQCAQSNYRDVLSALRVNFL